METFLYFAIVVIASAIAYATMAKPPKQKPLTLDDFDLPTAEEGRSIPWIFGTYKITDPNIIWYGDLEVRTKTKDKVKTRLYRMGLHLELCISPVDALVALEYGGKDCGIPEVTESDRITISLPNLFGGRDKEGGIDGDFDICFGEPTQAQNDYLLAQIGSPLSAFRDSLTIVGRKPSLVANNTYIKPLHPTVRCTKAGWADGSCWYPETCEIGDPGDYGYDVYAASLNLYGWYKLSGSSGTFANEGSSPYSAAASSGTRLPTFEQPKLTEQTEDAKSLRFDASKNSYLRAQHPAGPSAMTIGVWVKYDTLSSSPGILQTDYNAANDNYAGVTIRAGSDGGVWLMFGNGAGKIGPHRKNYYSLLYDIIKPGRRHFVTFRCNATSVIADLQWEVRVDGVEVDMIPIGGTATTIAWNGGYALFGWASNYWGDCPMSGQIDEPFITLEELSAAEIKELYRLGTTPGSRTGVDMNPAHMIYKVLTDTDQGLGEPSATIDDTNFRAAADTFYAESLGLSTQWRNEGDVRSFIAEICKHAGAVLSLDPRTGLTQLIPLRDDYTPGALDLFTEDDVLEVVEWQDAADGEAVNEVAVEFRQRDGSTGSVSWPNRASIQQLGRIHETMSFPMVPRRALAARIAKRETLQRSSNLAKGKIKVNRLGWDKLPGRVFRFSHAPEGIDELVVRVIDIDIGTLTDGAITISVVQDIFSLGDDLGDIGDQESQWEEPDTAPAAAVLQGTLEAPYWQLISDLGLAETGALAVGAGYVVALAGKPTALSTGYNTWTRIDPAEYLEGSADLAFAPTATLGLALDRESDSAIALIDPVDLDLVESGWLAVIGEGALAEICYVFAVDTDAKTATLLRGRLDTTPQEHALGTRVWFLDGNAIDWQRDPTARTDADVVDVKLQTATDAGLLDLADATAMSLTMASRQVRPYPPGYLEINGEFHPVELEGALTVTWAHRDRVVQGVTHVSQYDATDYGPEAGTTYNAYAYDDDTDTLLDSDTAIAGASWTPAITTTCNLRIEIESERDGYVSWQRQVRVFGYIAGGSLLFEDGDAWLTEAGEYTDEE
ncbi:MAG: hypothetical protein KBG29_01490 [Pseudomonadales bacterium]|nr:hypothetical protein [Pseudomonadales bacterium]